MMWLFEKLITIKSKHFIYKDNACQLTSSMFSVYYKSLFGIRVSYYYSSYSQAEKAKTIFNPEF